jgi:hypothetical protein
MSRCTQEAKLKQWQSPRRPSSTLDNFAAASGYGSFAADAMARVRARLAGFEDDDTLNMQQPPGKSIDERAAAAADTRQDLQGGLCLSEAPRVVTTVQKSESDLVLHVHSKYDVPGTAIILNKALAASPAGLPFAGRVYPLENGSLWSS